MTTNDAKPAILFADSAIGIYIPQCFAESHNPSQWKDIDADDLATLLQGPETEFYWDAWDSVLNNAETLDGGVLYQNGDLWVIWPDQARDALNAYFEQCQEYEESHIDSGNNYADLVPDQLIYIGVKSLRDELLKTRLRGGTENIGKPEYWQEIPEYEDLNPQWADLSDDDLLDISGDCFNMVSGNIWGAYGDNRPVLASFPLQDIEIQFDHDSLGVDGVTFDFVKDNVDAYIKGDCAYISTDAVWYAVLDIERFNAAIADHFAE